MLEQIDQLQTQAVGSLEAASGPEALEAWRLSILGKSGKLAALMSGLKDVPKDQKPAVGAKLNQARAALEEAYNARKSAAGPAVVVDELVDVTEPGSITSFGPGRRHIITRVIDELVDVFGRMGFEVATGPEVEDDDHNFVKLNIPAAHPARDPADNFYVDDVGGAASGGGGSASPRMMRSQTSTVQVRVMEEMVRRDGGRLKTPIKVVSPGRVYRPDTVDATHSFMFHQLEGLCVDRKVSMVDLKTTLYQFIRAYFGEKAEVRFTPTFYPFTEPSAQFEILVQLRPDLPVKWMELGGCGMVHPNVLRMCGVDPEEWSGFAFGFGIERLAMGKYAIPDIRMLFENDVRFLKQL